MHINIRQKRAIRWLATAAARAHLFDGLDELDAIALVSAGRRRRQQSGGLDALLLQRRQAASEDGLADQSDGDAVVERRYGRPLARALLAGRVADLFHQVFT